MVKTRVKSHVRKGKRVKSYQRKKRPKGKKRIIVQKPVKLYPVRDEFGRRLGWSRKRR